MILPLSRRALGRHKLLTHVSAFSTSPKPRRPLASRCQLYSSKCNQHYTRPLSLGVGWLLDYLASPRAGGPWWFIWSQGDNANGGHEKRKTPRSSVHRSPCGPRGSLPCSFTLKAIVDELRANNGKALRALLTQLSQADCPEVTRLAAVLESHPSLRDLVD